LLVFELSGSEISISIGVKAGSKQHGGGGDSAGKSAICAVPIAGSDKLVTMSSANIFLRKFLSPLGFSRTNTNEWKYKIEKNLALWGQ
jgi:hypothetical protein